uniref:Zinc finger protein GLIS2 n=2 Tax=Lygus hesperus TaxID=30085 RepID=A0A146L8P3_LYGHE
MVVFQYSPYQSDSDGSVSSGESVHGQGAPVKCMWDTCGEWFSTLEDLASHVGHSHAVAGKGGLFYCGWNGCSRGDRGFNARYKMLVHVRTHTNEKPHQCFICDKSFSRAENLKIHARSHTGERPYVCPVVGCGKAYSNSSDRFKHTRTHSVDKPYVCKVPGCPKRYTDPSSLRKHVKTYRHFPTHATAAPLKTEVDWDTRTTQMTDFAARVSRRTPSPEPTKAEPPLYPSTYYPTDCIDDLRHDQVADRMEQAPSISPQPGCCVPAIHAGSLYPSPFPSWPGLLQWYHLPEQQQTACYSEQETPLDLTSPIRLQHRV